MGHSTGSRSEGTNSANVAVNPNGWLTKGHRKKRLAKRHLRNLLCHSSLQKHKGGLVSR